MKRLIDFFRKPQAPSAPKRLRCWPGCTAIVVSDGEAIGQALAGVTVKVRTLVTACSHEPAWTYEGHILLWQGFIPVQCIPDAILRPIVPPGDTVTDEEVRDLYAPKQMERA